MRPEVNNVALRNPIGPFRYWCLSGKKKTARTSTRYASQASHKKRDLESVYLLVR